MKSQHAAFIVLNRSNPLCPVMYTQGITWGVLPLEALTIEACAKNSPIKEARMKTICQ